MYALYKQATAGKAPGYNAKTPRRALLRGAELAAWRSLQDMPSQEAKRLYAKCVADNRRNRESRHCRRRRTATTTTTTQTNRRDIEFLRRRFPVRRWWRGRLEKKGEQALFGAATASARISGYEFG